MRVLYVPLPLKLTGKLTGRGFTDGTAQPQKIKQHQLPTNRSISFDCLSLSRFPLKMLIDPYVTVLSSRLFQLLITRSEKKWCLKLVDALFHKLQWVTSCCSIAVEFKKTCQMRLMIFRERSARALRSSSSALPEPPFISWHASVVVWHTNNYVCIYR